LGTIKSSPFYDNVSGNIYFTSTDGKVYCRTAATLTAFPAGWTDYNTTNSIETTPFVNWAETPKALYFGANNGMMYKINAATGAEIWKYQTGTGSTAIKSMAVVYNDVVYFGSDDGRCYALGTDGTPKSNWPVITGGAVKAAPVLGGWNGSAYTRITFTSNDGKVYSLQIP
jgi:outer membrane protein assembly factor BamB